METPVTYHFVNKNSSHWNVVSLTETVYLNSCDIARVGMGGPITVVLLGAV
jgi:hypothetical protein